MVVAPYRPSLVVLLSVLLTALTSACAGDAAGRLSRVEAEPPGAACPDGGTKLLVGDDADGDGFLDEEEVESTALQCNPEPPPVVAYGDLVVRAGENDEHYQDLEVVVGNLQLEGTGGVALPRLRAVTGSLSIVGPERVALPLLEEVGQALYISVKEELALPVLRGVGGDLTVSGFGDLQTTVELPALDSVGGTLRFDGLLHVETLRFPTLGSVHGDLVLNLLDQVQTLDLHDLYRIDGDIEVTFTRLQRFELPALQAFSGSITVLDNPALTTVGLPEIEDAVDLRIVGDVLAEVDLRALGDVATVEIAGHEQTMDAPGPGTLALVKLDALPRAGALRLAGFGPATSLALPMLVAVDGELALVGLGDLAAIDVPMLTRAQTIRVEGGAHLADLHLGQPTCEVRDLILADLDFTDTAMVTLPTRVAGTTWVRAAAAADLRALAGVRHTGRLRLTDNPTLHDLSGLDPSLTLDSLEITGNPALVDLGGLAGVTVIGGDVVISGNASLSPTTPLGLVAIGGDLTIEASAAMTSLGWLGALDVLGGALAISGGGVPASEIDALRAHLGK